MCDVRYDIPKSETVSPLALSGIANIDCYLIDKPIGLKEMKAYFIFRRTANYIININISPFECLRYFLNRFIRIGREFAEN